MHQDSREGLRHTIYILKTCYIVKSSYGAPFRARPLRYRYPGLKPWAETFVLLRSKDPALCSLRWSRSGTFGGTDRGSNLRLAFPTSPRRLKLRELPPSLKLRRTRRRLAFGVVGVVGVTAYPTSPRRLKLRELPPSLKLPSFAKASKDKSGDTSADKSAFGVPGVPVRCRRCRRCRRMGPVRDIVIVAQHFSAGLGPQKMRPSRQGRLKARLFPSSAKPL